MTWLAILRAVLTVAGALVSWLRERELLHAGRAEIIAANLTAAIDEIAKANVARDRVCGDYLRNPASLRDDDEFRRPD